MNSSRKPSHPHSQRNLSSEIGPFIALNQEIFAQLLTFVDFAEKFTIGFVEINFPPDVKILVEALKTNPECRHIQFVSLSFSDANLRFLRDEIIKILPTIEIESNRKLVLIIQGLEKSIGVYGDYPPVLQDLNFVRDAYKRTVPHPILFILPDYALTRLAKFAPDFWAWQSGIFRFKTPQITKDYAINEAQTTERIINRLEPSEKQERIDLLHRLLMEYKPTGHNPTGENLRNCSNILHQLGVAYLSKIEPIKAREYLEEAEKIASEFPDSTFHAEVLNTLGDSYSQQRQFDRAIAYYQKSLSISQQLQNPRGEIAALLKLGNAYLELRQFTQATTFYQQRLEIEQQIGDRYSQADTYHQLGMVAQKLREFEEARRNYQQAFAIFIEFDDRYSQADTYHQLGRVAQELDEFEEARYNYQQALAIFIEFDDRYSQADTYHQLGYVAQDLREFEEARRNYQQALAINIEFGDRYSQADTYHELGRVAQNLFEFEEARRNYQQALAIDIEFGDSYSQASTYGQLGTLAEAEENYAEARVNLQTALEIYVEYEDEYWGAIAREALKRLPE
ncbi:tetratricopeptide repeat protein [Nostoc sp.]|uniref:tetratricopeptide repeat protein n=1 Tax=Nostoc sp. TaxID=1180 RepID=UPI002FFC788C